MSLLFSSLQYFPLIFATHNIHDKVGISRYTITLNMYHLLTVYSYKLLIVVKMFVN